VKLKVFEAKLKFW